jgi:hypothetical protein
MSLKISDFMTEHRIIILIDIIGYSVLSDDHQLIVVKEITNKTKEFIKKGGYEKESIFSGFLPTGDGFYLVGDTYQSLFWANLCVAFALTLRNVLIDSFSAQGIHFEGVKTAIHFGATKMYTDIADNENYCGNAMNITSRLLSPRNNDEIDHLIRNFYNHNNIVVISKIALDKIGELPEIGIIQSENFTLKAKHGVKIECIFLDLPLTKKFNLFSL